MDSSDDPNDDPEFVRMFTIRDSDEDPESDDEAFISTWRTSLQPSENPYDIAARVLQANEELFSQPIAGSHSETKVTFDLIPQIIIEGGDGDSANMKDTKTNRQTRFKRKDTASYIRYPRRFSRPQLNRSTGANNQHDNLTQAPLLSPQPNTSEDQQQTYAQTCQKEKPSPKQVRKQSHEQVLQLSDEQSLQQSPEHVLQQSPEHVIQQSPEPVPQQSQPQTPRSTPRRSQQRRRSLSKPPEPRRSPRMSS